MENRDNFIYEVSKEDQSQMHTVEQQQWIFANDNNNNNYSSNQITFDLSSFYNTSSLIDWRSAYLQIPLVSVVTIEGSTADWPNVFALKNGYNNIVNSIQVECSNSTVNQISNNINYYNNFKIYTNKSKDWFETAGPSIGYYGLDSHNSWKYYNTSNVNGFGSSNNNNFVDKIITDTANPAGFEPGNESLFNRTKSYLRFDNPSASVINANGAGNLITLDNARSMGMDYVTFTTTPAPATSTRVYYNTAIIRLGDIADFFDKLNLARCYVRLIVNVNVGSCKSTVVAGIPSAFSQTFSYNTCPFVICQKNANNLLTDVTAITASTSIVKERSTGNYQHNFSSCRVYAPQILLNPEKEKIYRMNNAQKLLVWNDIFSTSLIGTGPGSQANYVISNGLSRLVGILAIPMINSTYNVGVAPMNGCSPALSPFSSEPSTTSPLMSLYNYNLYIGGKAVMPSNLIFNFNTFNDQFIGVNALNGGAIVSGDLCSGSIDYNKWSNNYRYYFLDAERRNEADNSPKSISVQFTNQNAVAIDVFFFCIFKREAMIDIVTGQLQML
jgi:hypothetical protein